jgi:hypothetical protein
MSELEVRCHTHAPTKWDVYFSISMSQLCLKYDLPFFQLPLIVVHKFTFGVVNNFFQLPHVVCSSYTLI